MNMKRKATDLPFILDLKDLQQLLKLSRTSCYKLVHTKGFPASRLSASGAIRINRDALLHWLEHNGYMEESADG